jgi:hypothetical protein
MALRTINPETLAALASDPKLKPGDIAAGCGFSRAQFFFMLSQQQRLWDVYEAGRDRAGMPVSSGRLESLRVRRKKGDRFDAVELSILGAIGAGLRTMNAIRTFVIDEGHKPQTVAASLYNLENEKHEIWSATVGFPPQTHYFLRSEESVQQAASSGQLGNEVSTTSR